MRAATFLKIKMNVSFTLRVNRAKDHESFDITEKQFT